MKNFRFVPVMILITALTGSSALAGAPTESGEENALAYLGRELEKAHNLSERIPTSGGEAAICPEDGYLLLDIAK